MTRSILVIGQSHVAAFRAAARLRGEADPDRARTRVIHMREPRYAHGPDDDPARLSPALEREIRSQLDRHHPHVLSVIGGNAHTVLGLIRHPRPFDFRLGPDDDPDPDAQPLPVAQVRAALQAAMAHDLSQLRLLADLAGPLTQLESPPPLRDDALILKHADAFFRDAAIVERGVAPAGLRHRLWRLHGAIMRDACTAPGIGYRPVPAAVLSADGFLDPAFAADATHGNAAYGEAWLTAVETDHA